jgi:hypothetical protein
MRVDAHRAAVPARVEIVRELRPIEIAKPVHIAAAQAESGSFRGDTATERVSRPCWQFNFCESFDIEISIPSDRPRRGKPQLRIVGVTACWQLYRDAKFPAHATFPRDGVAHFG